MFLPTLEISPQTPVSEIVNRDYRTADVFRRHGIEYCCGGRWPLETACMIKGVDTDQLIRELQDACRNLRLPAMLPFEKWTAEFLADYIVNVHHHYLYNTLPAFEPMLEHFVNEHRNKYPSFEEIQKGFSQLQRELVPHMREEEEVIFPYIKQVIRAWKNKDSYGSLLVRTLRKPVTHIMDQEHHMFSGIIFKWRELTANYQPPDRACISHRVVLSKLRELDNDLVHHMYLENEVLFPELIRIEKELLRQG